MLPFYLFLNLLGEGRVEGESKSIVGGLRKLLQTVGIEVPQGYIWFKFTHR